MATQAQFEQQLTDRLNKTGVIKGLERDLVKREVQALLDALVDEAHALLKKGEDVRIRGLGTFKVAKRPPQKARMGRNPATGEEMKIKAKPASKRLKALPAKALKDRLRVK